MWIDPSSHFPSAPLALSPTFYLNLGDNVAARTLSKPTSLVAMSCIDCATSSHGPLTSLVFLSFITRPIEHR